MPWSSISHAHLRIGISFLSLALIPLLLQGRSESVETVRIAITPGKGSAEAVDSLRAELSRNHGRRLQYSEGSAQEFWELLSSDQGIETIAKKYGAGLIDSAPVDRLFTQKAIGGKPGSDLSIDGSGPATNGLTPVGQNRFAYLTGHQLQDIAPADFPKLLYPRAGSERMWVPDPNGTLQPMTVQSVTALSPDSFSYSIAAEGSSNGSLIFANPSGETGAIMRGDVATLMYAAGDSQVVVGQKDFSEFLTHPESFEAGAILTSADRLTRGALFDGAEFRTKTQVDCTSARSVRPIKVAFAYTSDAWKSLAGKVSQEKNPPKNMKEIYSGLASNVTSSLNLAFRQVEIGGEPLKFVAHSEVLHLQWESDGDGQMLRGAALAEWLVKRLAKPETQDVKQFNSLMLHDRGDADVVILFVGDSLGDVFGIAGMIRAMRYASFAIVRSDSALVNLTVAHEVGHILGARHQYDYACASSDANCPGAFANDELRFDDQDRAELGTPSPSRVPPNRAYVTDDVDDNAYGTVESRSSKTAQYSPHAKRLRLNLVSRDEGIDDQGRKIGSKQSNSARYIASYVPCLLAETDQVSPGPSPLPPGPRDEDDSSDHGIKDVSNLEYTTYFNFDSAGVRCGDDRRLRLLARDITANGFKTIYVKGFADTFGDESANQALSDRRAESVAAHILDEKLPQLRVCFAGFGETLLSQPTAKNIQLWRNRRVEVSWNLRCPGPFQSLCTEVSNRCIEPSTDGLFVEQVGKKSVKRSPLSVAKCDPEQSQR